MVIKIASFYVKIKNRGSDTLKERMKTIVMVVVIL